MKGLQNILYLNGNQSNQSFLALGCVDELLVEKPQNAFLQLKQFREKHPQEYVFGFFSYDLKNELEQLVSSKGDHIDTPALYFFIPQHLGVVQNGVLSVKRGEKKILEKELSKINKITPFESSIELSPSLTQKEYLNKIKSVQDHIQLGNIYEANFCYAFEGEANHFDLLAFYQSLNDKSNAPFSIYGKLQNIEIASASPERFIKKNGNTVVSQPIKGTIKRGDTKEEDNQLIETLKNNQKDRGENIMIVDLVRNDLSKIALPNSVQVEELCKIYSFDTLHQMISTVTASVAEDTDPVDIICATFPMGSMTGAPKIRAMELIEHHEVKNRGLYSGSIGYITPTGDFDFNVMIRTLLRNTTSGKISVSVGGAITALSDPQMEYEETILKAKVLLDTLKNVP